MFLYLLPLSLLSAVVSLMTALSAPVHFAMLRTRLPPFRMIIGLQALPRYPTTKTRLRLLLLTSPSIASNPTDPSTITVSVNSRNQGMYNTLLTPRVTPPRVSGARERRPSPAPSSQSRDGNAPHPGNRRANQRPPPRQIGRNGRPYPSQAPPCAPHVHELTGSMDIVDRLIADLTRVDVSVNEVSRARTTDRRSYPQLARVRRNIRKAQATISELIVHAQATHEAQNVREAYQSHFRGRGRF